MKSLLVCGHRGPSDHPISRDAPFFTSTTHRLNPTSRWGSFRTPYPTGPHWLNFVLGEGNNPATPIPYVVRARRDGFVVGFPNMYVYNFYTKVKIMVINFLLQSNTTTCCIWISIR